MLHSTGPAGIWRWEAGPAPVLYLGQGGGEGWGASGHLRAAGEVWGPGLVWDSYMSDSGLLEKLWMVSLPLGKDEL